MRCLAILVLLVSLASAAVAQEDAPPVRTRAMSAYHEQDWDSARSLLAAACAADPDDHELALYLRTAVQNVAGQYINTGRFAEALGALDEADRVDAGTVPPHIVAHAAELRALALAELAKRGEVAPPRRATLPQERLPAPDAAPESVQLADAAPGEGVVPPPPAPRAPDAGTYEAQAQKLLDAGDVAGAVALAKEGLALFPTAMGLNRLVGRHDPLAAGDRTRNKRVQSGHFAVRFRGLEPDPAVESTVLEGLEAAEASLARDFGFAIDHPVNVVIYASGQDYAAQPGAATWSEASYNGSIQVPLEISRMEHGYFVSVVTHELAHHMVALTAHRKVPLWFNEGLAQLAQGGVEDRTLRAALAPERRATLYHLADLTHSMEPTGDTSRVALAYEQSYSVVKELADRQGTAAVTGILADLAAGASFDTAFTARAGKSVAQFERDWLAARFAETGL